MKYVYIYIYMCVCVCVCARVYIYMETPAKELKICIPKERRTLEFGRNSKLSVLQSMEKYAISTEVTMCNYVKT